MTVTTLDPTTALVVIDLQQGLAGFPTAHPLPAVVARAAALARAMRERGLPVVLVNVDGLAPGRADQRMALPPLPPGWTDFIPELGQQPGDHVVTKRRWGAFTDTDLAAHLRGRGVTQVILCGVATSAGVESTARHAHELGFNVTLAADAMTDTNAAAHANSLERIFPRIGEVGSTADILACLAARAA